MKFQQFVSEGKGFPSPLEQTRHQLLLSDDTVVGQFSNRSDTVDLREHSKAQRQALAKPLVTYMEDYGDRDTAMAAAYKSDQAARRMTLEQLPVSSWASTLPRTALGSWLLAQFDKCRSSYRVILDLIPRML